MGIRLSVILLGIFSIAPVRASEPIACDLSLLFNYALSEKPVPFNLTRLGLTLDPTVDEGDQYLDMAYRIESGAAVLYSSNGAGIEDYAPHAKRSMKNTKTLFYGSPTSATVRFLHNRGISSVHTRSIRKALRATNPNLSEEEAAAERISEPEYSTVLTSYVLSSLPREEQLAVLRDAYHNLRNVGTIRFSLGNIAKSAVTPEIEERIAYAARLMVLDALENESETPRFAILKVTTSDESKRPMQDTLATQLLADEATATGRTTNRAELQWLYESILRDQPVQYTLVIRKPKTWGQSLFGVGE